MINNGSLKTSKGVKSNDAPKSFEDDKAIYKLEKDKSKGSLSNQYPFYRGYKNVRYSSCGNKFTFDNRQRDDYKMARGSYTRKPTRVVSKRDHDTNYNPRRKFQDSAKDFGGTEDTRISKTLRRMVREDDPDAFSSLCIQLQESILVPENERYIRKAMEFICESILDMLHSGPCYETKFMAAKCLSHLAIALDCDAKRFFDWIFTKYVEERNVEVRALLMKSILHMLQLDKDHVLAEFAGLIIGHIQNILENAEVPDLVLITGKICYLLMEEYIEVFAEFFKDTVDILVGWHIDIEQSQSVIRVMAFCLQSLAPYWISDLGFTVSLLGQLLEDMERYANDYRQICNDYATLNLDEDETGGEKEHHSLKLDSLRCLAKTMSFMKVFNSITKTVGQYLSPVTSPTVVSWNFLVDSLSKVVRTLLSCMETETVDEELIITGNECAWLLISLMQSKLNPGQDTVCKLIQVQLMNAPTYSNNTLSSMLQLISKVVKEGSANLPEELIKTLIGPESYILKLRFSTNTEVHRGTVAVYQSLLNLKNIPLLQEAYRYILGDMEKAYLVLDSASTPFCSDNPHTESPEYTLHMAQVVLLFHLKALSDLANAGGSIIGMWVLQPCILELLAVKLQPTKSNLTPSVRYAILYLLYSHCLRYSNFISSSDLVTSVQGRTNMCDLLRIMGSDITPTSSPTSGHLTVILNLLEQLLKMELDVECTMLVLKWCGILLNNAQVYLSSLLITKEFLQTIEALIEFGCKSTAHYAIEIVLDDLIIFLLNPNNWDSKPNLLQNIAELCFIHLNSINVFIKQKCKDILMKLPWSTVICVLRSISQKQNGFFNRMLTMYRTHMSRGTNGEVQSQHFKLFLSYILDKTSSDDQTSTFLDSFYNCWNSAESKSEFESLVPCFESALLFWETWECAQYCVVNKLRTTLGKPQDTFMAIEGALKNLARETTRKHTESGSGFSLKRVRLLLEFVEQLEKNIYNASDGTAAALLAAPKPVRTFFHTNKSTCAEWLSRIRLILVMVSLHAGLSTTAVRHGYCLLQDMAQAGHAKGSDFINALMYISWALYSINESEAIEGLYAWCNESFGMSFPFLKGLSDQAAFKYESALETYLRLVDDADNDSLSLRTSELSLSDSIRSNDSMPDSLRSFIADQITECYLDLNDWSQLKEWKKKEADFLSTINGGCVQRYNHVTVKEASMYGEIDAGNLSGVNMLMDWNTFSCSNNSVKSGWNTRHLLTQTKQNLLEKFMVVYMDESKCEQDMGVINDFTSAIENFLSEDIRNLPSPLVEDFATLLFVASSYFADSKTPLNNFTMEISGKKLGSKRLGDALWWTKIIEKYRKCNLNIDKPANLSELCLQLIKSARKEGNMHLTSRQLLNHFEKVFNALGTMKNFDNGRKPYNILLETITNQSTTATTSIWSVDNTDALLELSKLAYRYKNEELAIEICAMTALGITHAGGIADPFIRDKTSSLLLKLAKWLSADVVCADAALPFASCTTIQKLITLLNHNIHPVNNSSSFEIMSYDFSSSIIPEKDVTVGNLLRISVVQSPTLAKAWNRFGNWCYRWGRTVVDKQNNLLTAADKMIIDSLIPAEVSNKEDVYSILTRIKPPVDEEDIEADNVNTTELIEWQLRSTGQFSDDQMIGLIEVWRNTHARIYAYYHLAAQAYFKYLQLSDLNENGPETVTATLRLLRLIVKYSLELQSVFEVELGYTPTTPWKCIIPQLFSRLSHPEPYVRRRVSELLSRLAEDAPHLITFPAVVGSDSGATGTINNMPTSKLFKSCLPSEIESDPGMIQDEDEMDDEDDDEVSQDDQGRILENCYLAMVDALAKQVPDTICQVQLLVRELRRITLLWDELWLGALTQHYSDMGRRINQLSMEVNRIDSNRHLSEVEKDSLVMEKYMVLVRPLLFILEQLEAITSVKPETPHEQWFQKTFGEYITNTINTLQNPRDPRKPQDAWKSVKLLQCQLQRKASKRSSYSLKMSDISPALAALKNTSIAMPGVEQYITIASVHNQISVLPTKTKPKKLIFRGSDGKMYTYLFKGLEDLHLDERIMQFLSIANTMLKESGYQARHYSVIPLGPRSGLISWVDHVTPIFAVYKRWQQREAVVNNQNNVMRPSDLFYAKLTPLLKEHGISNLDNRKEWPLTVLVQVLTALMKETPDNLLAKELWCQSLNTGAWWKSLRLYSTSLAVMSVIGYIIGLGDRHLDNVLVHLTTGEVIHIDYNVCFEKGKTLRVPEKVPFRMTPNLRTALGVTGIEGIFRLTCERVMEVLKQGKETLLTLLEAFVYDPLIDWTPGIETGYTGAVYGGGRALALKNKQSRKQLEHEVTTSMFTIRMAEIKADWFENRDKVNTGLNELRSNTEKWIKTEENLNAVMDGLAKGSQQLEVLKAAAAHPQHNLYTLHSRYQSRKDASDAMIKAQIGLKQKLEECDAQLAQYKMLFYHLRGEQLSQWLSDLNNRKEREIKLFDVITDFLKSTGVNQLVTQCLQSENELNEATKEQIPSVITCLDLLKKYSMVSALYPASSSLKHRCTSYKRWIHMMLEFPSPNVCDNVLSDFNLLCVVPIGNENLSQQAKNFSENIHQRIIEMEYSLKTRVEKLEKINGENENNITQMEQTIGKMSDSKALTLQCAVINELCQLNKRFLKMETAALGAGNCLMVLTTLDGEWFLDDMCLMTEVSIKLASYILSPSLLENNPGIHLVTKCLDLLHGIYKRLQELNVNFSTIIIPETMKNLLIEDETVLDMISQFNLIISSCSLSLPELIKELQTHLRYMIMGMPSPHPNCVAVATELRRNFNTLINERSNPLSNAMTEGQMLLMGINGLFTNIFKSTADLFSLLPALAMTNTTWNSVDLIKDTRSLIGPVFNKDSQILLQDLFLVKYIHTMHEFFHKCQMTAAAYRGGINMPTVYHSSDELNKLIKKFTADYLSQQLLGLFSYTFATTIGLFLQHIGFNIIAEVEQRDIGAESKVPMEELCQKAIDQQRQRETISTGSYSHASSILSSLQIAWKRIAVHKRLTLEVKSLEVMLQNLKLQYTTHKWLHVDSLNSKALSLPIIDRSEFMIEMKLSLTSLITSQLKITELKEQQEALITSARTRLKWAAGSNPSLNDVMNTFEENLKSENENFTHFHQLAATIINMCTCVLKYESLRVQTSDTMLSDTQFVQLVNNYKEACNLVMSLATATFTPEEENLIQLLPPITPIDSVWINEADALISDSIKKLGQELEPLKNCVSAARDEVKSMATSLRLLLSEHHKILVDVRSLLKSMMKFEDNEEFIGIPNYLIRHKTFCEQLNAITKDLSTTELTEVKGQLALKQLHLIQQQIDYIYEELLKFAAVKQPTKAKRPPLLRQESIHLSPKKRLPQDPRTGKIMQERNEYAMNVWRRVRMKLDGRDLDHAVGRRLSVQEQVDKIIKDATNIENLALLYEGWTPWV